MAERRAKVTTLDGWEVVDEVPRSKVASGRPPLELEPGQVIRKVGSNSLAFAYNRTFKKQGRTDYHAAMRVIDGVKWCYIWRDPLPGSQA